MIVVKSKESNNWKPFKVGEKVEIIANVPFVLKNKPKPLFGTITNIDGAYISVKPKYHKWIAEFYPSELKHLNI